MTTSSVHIFVRDQNTPENVFRYYLKFIWFFRIITPQFTQNNQLLTYKLTIWCLNMMFRQIKEAVQNFKPIKTLILQMTCSLQDLHLNDTAHSQLSTHSRCSRNAVDPDPLISPHLYFVNRDPAPVPISRFVPVPAPSSPLIATPKFHSLYY